MTRTSDRSILHFLGPLLDTDNEVDAWHHAAAFVRRHFSADLAAAVEFLGDDRAVFRSSEGFVGVDDDVVFAVAPDSQAAFVRSSDFVCCSDEITVDGRFVAADILTRIGVRSAMSVSFDLADHDRGLLGVYSRTPSHFADAEHETLSRLAVVLRTVIDRIRRQRELEVAARIDPVSGLDNRSTILGGLDERLRARSDVTALLVDLDGFKSVNDQHGHRTGDAVLQTIARRIGRFVEAGDHVGRLGGDEFLILFDGDEDTTKAEQIIGHIEEVIMVESRTISVSASIGISHSRTGDDVSAVLERADRMMYAAKAMGRGHVRAEAPVRLEAGSTPAPSVLRPTPNLSMVDQSITKLNVVVQPIVEATTGVLHGVEALVRGIHGDALEFPDRLFNAATTFGRVAELELESKRLAFDLDLDDDIVLYINLEPALLCDSQWLARLADTWHASGTLRPVVAEVTERSVMEHPGQLLDAVSACRALGWRIALDDVGSRSESLAALRWIEPDIVKLDMSLIRNENPAHSAHVVAAVTAYRTNTSRPGVIVIAEGVETEADAVLADALGADLLQGYRYGRPGPVEDLKDRDETLVDRSMTRTIPYLGERIGSLPQLLSMTRHIEAAALSSDCVVLSSLQTVDNFTRRTRRQYQAMARRCGFVGVLGMNVTSAPESEVRGIRLADLEPDDPMTRNWQVLAISPTISLGLLATELPAGPGAPVDDARRLFRYQLVSRTTDVEAAVRRLLRYF